MNILRRACLYIRRKKERSFILFIVFFVMGLFMLAGISVHISALKEAENVKKSIPVGINIQQRVMNEEDVLNFEKTETGEIERILKIPLLTESTLRKILEIDGITGYYEDVDVISLYTGLNVQPGNSRKCLEEINAQDPETWTEQDKELKERCETSIYENGFYPVVEGRISPFFKNGAVEICEGRNIEKGDKGKAVISEELAEENQLKVGDKLEASLYDKTGDLYGESLNVEIIGIFHMNFEEKVDETTSESNILSNLIFTDKKGIAQWHDREWGKYNGIPNFVPWEDPPVSGITLFVKNPERLDYVEEKIRNIDSSVDWQYYEFQYDNQDYKAVAKPLLMMVTLSIVLIVIMGVGTLVILSLVLSMWMQSRKKEIRILSLIGVKKKSIVAQFVLECSILAIVAFVLAGIIAVPVTDITGTKWSKFVNRKQSDQPYETSINERLNVEVHRTANESVALQYSLTWPMIIIVFLVMLLVIVTAVVIAYVRIGGHRAREIGL